MPRQLITAPAVDPVTTAEAKTHLRVDHADHDTLIGTLIKSAVYYVENYTRRALITQTWDLFLDRFETENEIPLPSLQSVTTVKYLDDAGVQQTLAATGYKVDVASERGRVVLAYGESWPTVRDEINAIEIRFIAGYGLAVAVPDQLKDAIKLHVQILYDGPVGDDLKSLERTRDALLDGFTSTRYL